MPTLLDSRVVEHAQLSIGFPGWSVQGLSRLARALALYTKLATPFWALLAHLGHVLIGNQELLDAGDKQCSEAMPQ